MKRFVLWHLSGTDDEEIIWILIVTRKTYDENLKYPGLFFANAGADDEDWF